ncbi:hypothetical protein KI429_09865 [Pseudomonas shirazica]|uniref:hypothetical protein n=1 Tax=Pseudomonas TaxID=286 RepID=UPI000AFF3583|nr:MULTISPECIES: hypothetical protein [Pseudomonas]MBA6111742.1 hypothetical protein [Pseudomonas asiatica]UQB79732.1 hypothetical protein KI429_09865 [Pseudomonas shirazica]GLO33001.1 hypothetical protein PPUN12996_50600 [Pseudomonas putida]
MKKPARRRSHRYRVNLKLAFYMRVQGFPAKKPADGRYFMIKANFGLKQAGVI